MPNFIDCWDLVQSKGYKHDTGRPVLTAADKKSIKARIEEHLSTGIDPHQAALLAVDSHLGEADSMLRSVYEKTGKTPPEPEALTKLRELTGDSNTAEAMGLGAKVPKEFIPELEKLVADAKAEAERVIAEVDAMLWLGLGAARSQLANPASCRRKF
jgi:hypothetical protein